jgi:hypothetical protein
MPRASVGPDATIRVFCGQSAQAPVASVSDSGGGITSWSISLDGDPHFALPTFMFQTCVGLSPTVALVSFGAPNTAVPGDTFDTVATVSADDGSFPAGTAKVHAEIVAPTATVDKAALELGDVLVGTVVQQVVTFHLDEAGVSIAPPTDSMPFAFSFAGRTGGRQEIPWRVTAGALAPGDYTYASKWAVGPRPGAYSPECDWHVTIPLHVRVVAPGGDSADGGADAADGPERR